jgi:hypothetical protein
MVAVSIPAARHSAGDDRRFYVWMGLLAAAVTVVGFTPRYFLPLSAGTFHAPTLVHLHGLVMFSWIVLFVVQSTLAARGRLPLHRTLGVFGVAVLTLVVWTGAEVALLQMGRRLAAGVGDRARAFAAFPLSLCVLLVPLFVAAILRRREPEHHQRLMLLVTLIAINPALARVIAIFTGTPGPKNAVAGGVAILGLIAAAAARDVRLRGAVHPAYAWGGAFVAVVQIARATLNDTAAWYAVTDALLVLTH